MNCSFENWEIKDNRIKVRVTEKFTWTNIGCHVKSPSNFVTSTATSHLFKVFIVSDGYNMVHSKGFLSFYAPLDNNLHNPKAVLQIGTQVYYPLDWNLKHILIIYFMFALLSLMD